MHQLVVEHFWNLVSSLYFCFVYKIVVISKKSVQSGASCELKDLLFADRAEKRCPAHCYSRVPCFRTYYYLRPSGKHVSCFRSYIVISTTFLCVQIWYSNRSCVRLSFLLTLSRQRAILDSAFYPRSSTSVLHIGHVFENSRGHSRHDAF